MSNDWQFFFFFSILFLRRKSSEKRMSHFPMEIRPVCFANELTLFTSNDCLFLPFFFSNVTNRMSLSIIFFSFAFFVFFCAVCSGVGSFLAEIRDIEAVSMCLLSVQCRKLIESGWNGNERINGQGDLTAAKKKTIRTEQKRTKSKIEIYL